MIAVEGVSLVQGNFSLSSISFTVPEGSYSVLMGPSGAGKTLLLETIAGFYPVRTGSITLGHRDVTGLSPESRGVGFVYQDYSLFPHLSVTGNVAYGLKMAGTPSPERDEVVRTLMDRVGILPLAGRYPGTLSGGEQQRVALARALAIGPSVLLLDEPFAALDPDARQSCMRTVKHIQEEQGLTVLQVSHSREEAYLLADQVVIMHKGTILQAGVPGDVFHHPANRTAAVLAGYENILETTAGPSGGDEARLLIGEETIRAEGRFTGGESLLACIRAGDILLADASSLPGDHLQGIPGNVISRTPTDSGYRIQVGGTVPLTVDVSSHEKTRNCYQPGDRVIAIIDPSHVHVVRDDRITVGPA